MNEQIKHKWVEALRSGEYEQGDTYLNYNGHFCCLGVLTDLYIKKTNQNWRDSEGFDTKVKSFQEGVTLLPRAVQSWAEIDYMGEVNVTTRQEDRTTLVDCNDGAKLTFNQIADVINYAL